MYLFHLGLRKSVKIFTFTQFYIYLTNHDPSPHILEFTNFPSHLKYESCFSPLGF